MNAIVVTLDEAEEAQYAEDRKRYGFAVAEGNALVSALKRRLGAKRIRVWYPGDEGA